MRFLCRIISIWVALMLVSCGIGGDDYAHDSDDNEGGQSSQEPTVLITGVWLTNDGKTLLYLKENNSCEEYRNVDINKGTYTHKYTGGADYSYDHMFVTFYDEADFVILYDEYDRRYEITELSKTTMSLKELFVNSVHQFTRREVSDVPQQRDIERLLLAGCAWGSKTGNVFYFRKNNSVEYWPRSSNSAAKGTFLVSGNKLICNFTTGEFTGTYEYSISVVNDDSNNIKIDRETFKYLPTSAGITQPNN